MRRVLTASEMREVDAAAIEKHGMPAAVLMENAGAALAHKALELASPEGRFFILCGGGNNGGDGLVAARVLAAMGRAVFCELLVPAEGLTGEAQRNHQALVAAGQKPAAIGAESAASRGDVVIDALLGTGLSRAPEGVFAEAVARIASWRRAGAKVLSADVPSGIQSDTGVPYSPSVRADATVAFGALKLGLVLEPGASWCGDVTVADIGIPAAASKALAGARVEIVEEADAREVLTARSADSHKGTYGHVLVVAGSWGKSGAAALTAKAALRSGAGLVTVATRPEALMPVLGTAPELMGVELIGGGGLGASDLNPLLDAADGKAALVMGPGMPRGEETARLLSDFLEEVSVPVVLDADALNAMAGAMAGFDKVKSPMVLTPHPGEMARLLGKTTPEVQADRLGAARALASKTHAVVVLKGSRTVIAREDGSCLINPTGNAGMATAGAGDVLAGMIGAFLAQGADADEAAFAAVFAHGLAGDLAASRRGKMGLIASDLIETLGEVWVRWGR